MKKIYIYITFPVFAFLSSAFLPVYADGSEKSDNRENAGFNSTHSEHPPHDHHDPDHLKYIRTRDEKKKKKLH
ncbi:MAG: hypothetical protein PHY14_05115 [Candidatus Gracilibacteria bacterium]|nr:hypothetical protein [Candidatus Gracilibacteria bacterium]